MGGFTETQEELEHVSAVKSQLDEEKGTQLYYLLSNSLVSYFFLFLCCSLSLLFSLSFHNIFFPEEDTWETLYISKQNYHIFQTWLVVANNSIVIPIVTHFLPSFPSVIYSTHCCSFLIHLENKKIRKSGLHYI